MAKSQYIADSAIFFYSPSREFNDSMASAEVAGSRLSSESRNAKLVDNQSKPSKDAQGSTQKAQSFAPLPSPWMFHSREVTPLAWWRCLPSDLLGEAEHLKLGELIGKIGVLKGREWVSAMRGDAAASIAIAIGALPIGTITLEVDLAMTTLALVALDGDAAAAFVLSQVLQRTSLDHPFSIELSASWLELNRRRAMAAAHQPLKPRAGSRDSVDRVARSSDLNAAASA